MGLINIDIVEGTTKEALPFMRQLVIGRPKYFDNIESAVKYMLTGKIMTNLNSARYSTPPIFEKTGEKYYWRTNLLSTE